MHFWAKYDTQQTHCFGCSQFEIGISSVKNYFDSAIAHGILSVYYLIVAGGIFDET